MTPANPAGLAADIGHGGQVFSANCASCHNNGLNVVVPAKTLKADALEANGKNSIEAIITQVTKGNGAMPAFGTRLSEADIQDVAAYVLDQAAKDWK